MANTVNFWTPAPPPLLHFSPESAKGSSYSTQLQSPVWQSHGQSSVHPTAPDSSVGQPFCVMFLNARISKCQGCRGTIEQGQSSPGDIVLQHKEYVLFQNPRTGSWHVKGIEEHILVSTVLKFKWEMMSGKCQCLYPQLACTGCGRHGYEDGALPWDYEPPVGDKHNCNNWSQYINMLSFNTTSYTSLPLQSLRQRQQTSGVFWESDGGNK